DELEGAPVRVRRDSAHADELELAHGHDVRRQRDGYGVAADAADHDAAPLRGELEGLRERRGRLGGDVDDHVGETAGRVLQRLDRVVDRDVDDEVGAEALRGLEAGRVTWAVAGD